jgi:hypothetical protein
MAEALYETIGVVRDIKYADLREERSLFARDPRRSRALRAHDGWRTSHTGLSAQVRACRSGRIPHAALRRLESLG